MPSNGPMVQLAAILADGDFVTEAKLAAVAEALSGLSRAPIDTLAPLYAEHPAALLDKVLETTARLTEGLLSLILRCLQLVVALVQRQLVEEDLQADGAHERAVKGLEALLRVLSADAHLWARYDMTASSAHTDPPAELTKLAVEMAADPPGLVASVLSCPQRPGGTTLPLLDRALRFVLRLRQLAKLPSDETIFGWAKELLGF